MSKVPSNIYGEVLETAVKNLWTAPSNVAGSKVVSGEDLSIALDHLDTLMRSGGGMSDVVDTPIFEGAVLSLNIANQYVEHATAYAAKPISPDEFIDLATKIAKFLTTRPV
jgi:hypothetical protein